MDIKYISTCATIGQCCLFVMGHSGRGSVFSVLWATVGGLRLPGNLGSLQETAAGLVDWCPAVTGEMILSGLYS